MKSYKISIQGVVQGVGFRPFIKNLADNLGLMGEVFNNSNGVAINISANSIDDFITRIRSEAPIVSQILSIDISEVEYKNFKSFDILKSDSASGVTLIPQDLAICDDCKMEITSPRERRFNYPFTNCTNCGPRYSITKALPYDRVNTTMAKFAMCDDCKHEYENSSDRRFHAQPIGCNKCGVTLNSGEANSILSIGKAINDGEIVAIKGIGGYHIICDALNDGAIKKLRGVKNRKTKPFAIMARDIETLDKYIKLDDKYRNILKSHEAPIVIFDWKDNPLSKLINPTSDKIGVMLAYTPLHYLLFNNINTEFIVATSGNFKDEPIVISEAGALDRLSHFTSNFLHNDRDINTRLDDSVVAVTDESYILLRRSRGFAPLPVMLHSSTNQDIFAAGANLKSTFTLYKDKFAFQSQYIGDLDNVETEDFYIETYNRLSALFNIQPKIALVDKHSGYRSSIFARSLGLELYEVQHHKAHFCSCLAENSFYGDAIGVILDGFGLGDDGSAWGGEFFIKTNNIIERSANIEPFIQPGLDSAAKHPVRMVISYLHKLNLLEKISHKLNITLNELNIVKFACENNVNSIYTTSAGRLFEAVGALILGLHSNEYEGEAAILLENLVIYSNDEYEFEFIDNTLTLNKMFTELVDDLLSNVDNKLIATKFHNGFATIIYNIVKGLASSNNISTVALSGGVFQNIYLLNRVTKLLGKNNLTVLTHRLTPANDAGVSLGQLYYYLQRIN